ncbi:hypothetical protein [Haloparvum sp. PAK95]|uniref:hypothetical protein n=1 Tax=Haloparvum sp. PAK95 TaxID=3418962 RepID=UPI003D2F3B7A
MKRRTLLATLGTVSTGAVAGCTGGTDGSDGSGSTPTDAPTDTPTDTPTTRPAHREATFTREGDCDESAAGSAQVAFGDAFVDVEGCLTARDGCHYPALADASYEGDVFRVVVEEVDESDPDEMCTEAIEYRAYEVEATFDSGTPETVEVVHVTAQGRETVAKAHD